MKILHVISLGYVAGGAEQSVAIMKAGLANRGHEVKVFSSDTPGPKPFSDYHFKTISPASVLKWFHHLFYLESYFKLKAVVASFRPDIIHFHTLTSCSPSVLFAAGKTPSVLTIHGPEEFTTQLLPWYLNPSDYRSTPFDLKDLRLIGFCRYWYYRLIQRPLYQLGFRRLKTIIAPSHYIEQATAADFPPHRMINIYNGIELSPALAWPDTPQILFVGRLERVKGVHILLEAFGQTVKALPEAKLLIVGDGSQRTELEAQTRTLDLNQHVSFDGWVAPEHIMSAYGPSQVLVIPSIWPENLPTVCIEAMAAGRPVIGSNSGGIPELIADGQTGFIVPMGDPNALAQRLIELLAHPELGRAMSTAAAQAAQRFSANQFIDQILAAYTRAKS